MLRFPVPPRINGRQLEKEIADTVGAPPGRVWVTQVGADITIEGVPDDSEAAVRAAIGRHTGDPTPAQKEDALLRTQLAAVLTDLEAAAVDPAIWRTLRADVKEERLRQAVVSVAALIRLRLSKFD